MIKHSSSYITDNDIQQVVEVLKSGLINDSDVTRLFEHEIIKYLGVSFAKATSTGTLALCAALKAVGVEQGHEVLTTTFVCADVLAAILYVGATPRFVDINPYDYNMDPVDFFRKINKNTNAVIVPHMFGVPADIEKIALANIPVIEDCAHSIGSSLSDKILGSIGDAGVFSFHALKSITTGEGGMVVSNKYPFENKSFAFSVDYHLSNVLSALGLSQLRNINKSLKKRNEIKENYDQLLSKANLILPSFTRGKGALIRYCIQFPYNTNIEQVTTYFRRRGVIVQRPVKKLLHHLYGNDSCPVADVLYEKIISLPAHLHITSKQQEIVVNILNNFIKATGK